MMTLDELKKRKKELGYSNQRIADLSGLPFGTVQKIFGGVTTTPRHETLVALNKALDVPRVVYSYEDATSDSDNLVINEPEPYYGSAAKKEFTIDDYYALPDDQRIELIDGEFYNMATPSIAHQIILGELYSAFKKCVSENHPECTVLFAPFDVQLDQDDYTMVQPDLLVFCERNNIRKNLYYGAPDFVLEILSPSTRSIDMFTKLNKYRFAGVKEYWIVDPKNRCVMTYDLAAEEHPERYNFDDEIPVGISEGKCIIDFAQIHKQVEQFLDDE